MAFRVTHAFMGLVTIADTMEALDKQPLAAAYNAEFIGFQQLLVTAGCKIGHTQVTLFFNFLSRNLGCASKNVVQRTASGWRLHCSLRLVLN